MACQEDDIDNSKSVITIDGSVENEFDKYIQHIYTSPYNIKFLYRWEDIESDMNYALVPADYENSIKMANMVKYLCLDAYEAVAPKNFLKRYFPKMIMMVGSPAYNNNNTMVLGTAEGGLKITLYNINNLNVDDTEQLFKYYFRTIFHEFSHILHQTKDYTTDFDRISATEYVGDSWSDAWEKKSCLEAGFISDYSSKEANEDFVELIAHYITKDTSTWAEMMDAAGAEGQAIINQKMEIVSSYLQEAWSIDINALRAEVLSRTEKLGEQNLDNITIE